MKPPAFRYVRPHSVEEAVAELGREGGSAKVLAGGQSLVPMLNFRLARPTALVDINRIAGLSAVADEDGALLIGALARHFAVESSPLVAARFPLLAAAARHVAHVTIRNRGTFVGSLAHADPAAEWPLAALLFDATIAIRHAAGERRIAARDFFVTHLTTALGEAEIITGVRLPEPAPGTGWGFEEVSRRHGDFALAAVGALVALEGGRCREVRIALAGVGATPLRAGGAEALLGGQAPTAEALRAAAAQAARDCEPATDIHATAALRRDLVATLTRRALQAAIERAAAN